MMLDKSVVDDKNDTQLLLLHEGISFAAVSLVEFYRHYVLIKLIF